MALRMRTQMTRRRLFGRLPIRGTKSWVRENRVSGLLIALSGVDVSLGRPFSVQRISSPLKLSLRESRSYAGSASHSACVRLEHGRVLWKMSSSDMLLLSIHTGSLFEQYPTECSRENRYGISHYREAAHHRQWLVKGVAERALPRSRLKPVEMAPFTMHVNGIGFISSRILNGSSKRGARSVGPFTSISLLASLVDSVAWWNISWDSKGVLISWHALIPPRRYSLLDMFDKEDFACPKCDFAQSSTDCPHSQYTNCGQENTILMRGLPTSVPVYVLQHCTVSARAAHLDHAVTIKQWSKYLVNNWQRSARIRSVQQAAEWEGKRRQHLCVCDIRDWTSLSCFWPFIASPALRFGRISHKRRGRFIFEEKRSVGSDWTLLPNLISVYHRE